MYRIDIPENVKLILDRLGAEGYDSYLVGGCVRDHVMGFKPHDYDVTTPATPDKVAACFPDLHVIETGLKHGTVTVVSAGQPVEITTFRTDGEYLDNRRPEHVTFVRDLESDLSRRDFTVNALAYSPERGLVDMFGGLRDIGDRVIRCVGDPETRFKEDGLRILRALRFASRLGFSIDSVTDRAIRKCRMLLDNISAERIFSELCGILTGDGAEQVVYDYSDVMFQIMPELEPMSRTEQNNPHHIYNVWEHTVKALGASEKGRVMRLAMLFHDSGKPARKTTDENGIDHFHGHPEVSCDIARTVLNRLRCDNQTKDDVLFLVRYHDTRFSPKDNRVRKFIADVGEERFRELMKAKRADMAAQSRMSQEKTGEELRRLGDILEEMKSSGACMSLKDMEINGRDLVEMGVPQGKAVGELLNRLYDMVVTEEIENNREQLIRKARQLIDGELTEM